MMKQVDGRISVVRAAESISIPQTSNHVFDFRKRSASAHTTLSTYGFKIMVSGFQLPIFFASGLQLEPGGKTRTNSWDQSELCNTFVRAFTENLRLREGSINLTIRNISNKIFYTCWCGQDKFSSPPHRSSGCMLSRRKGYSRMHWGLMEKSRTMNHDCDGNVRWEEVDGRYRERRGQSTVSHSRIKAKEFQTKRANCQW